MPEDHVEIIGEHIVDVVVIRRRLQRRLAADVMFGDRLEILVVDQSLPHQFSGVVPDGHLGSPLVMVYS